MFDVYSISRLPTNLHPKLDMICFSDRPAAFMTNIFPGTVLACPVWYIECCRLFTRWCKHCQLWDTPQFRHKHGKKFRMYLQKTAHRFRPYASQVKQCNFDMSWSHYCVIAIGRTDHNRNNSTVLTDILSRCGVLWQTHSNVALLLHAQGWMCMCRTRLQCKSLWTWGAVRLTMSWS